MDSDSVIRIGNDVTELKYELDNKLEDWYYHIYEKKSMVYVFALRNLVTRDEPSNPFQEFLQTRKSLRKSV